MTLTPEGCAERLVRGWEMVGNKNRMFMKMDIAQAIRDAVAAERERCAQIAKFHYEPKPAEFVGGNVSWLRKCLISAIRSPSDDG